MKRYYISYLSGLIFLTYGLISQKYIFVVLALIFGIIGYSDYLKQKKK
ncbi:hypothetical protein HMPREF9318_00815 [Streptococcus urinalis FB127-CNA-2]|uniref:Uncharacterized protein n=1 Tax=Streptococcus urinalis 2285-97 TaxID=764291 RepID=G5KHU9_9STRE|nr:hypothetical protein [Streptococcus urinalis]EHJ56703.1 hypothetical protein STRUR_1534 [Streptococcus urinalis 2285-97]EKS22617.1 hypothetical protein HMPREF9318_00815 [Streptococcus urinalis FB127-CNA-2]VEF32386.1 membrane protein [Streptococcus urinalis]